MRIIDNQGREFRSFRQAFFTNGVVHNGRNCRLLAKEGEMTVGDVTLRLLEYSPASPHTSTGDPMMDKLRARYNDDELKRIAEGKGFEQRFIPYPEIHLTGRHHRLLVMADTHIGSVYSPKEWHDVVADYANDPANGIECILHCGDLVEGMKLNRMGTQIWELSEIGYVAQRDEAVRLMSKYNPPIYIISGNHDRFFVENFGNDIVADVCDRVPNMTKIGDDSADIEIDGCKIRLFHGGDGSSYAISYSLQKLVEAMNGGTKPNILIRGHIHKYCVLFTRNVHAISCPSMQAQSAWMRGKRLEAHIGFLVLDFDVEDGQVCNLGVVMFPFYA